jgi:hypothetical protein
MINIVFSLVLILPDIGNIVIGFVHYGLKYDIHCLSLVLPVIDGDGE